MPHPKRISSLPCRLWRFYPDSGLALVIGVKNGYECELLESYVANQGNDGMVNDFVAIIVKNKVNAQCIQNALL